MLNIEINLANFKMSKITMESENSKRELLVASGLEESIVFRNPDYEDAIVGYDIVDNRVIYDYDLMAESLVKEYGITLDEAVDIINYDTIGSLCCMGEKKPIILKKLED